MKISTFFQISLVIIITVTVLTACSSESPAVNESWALIDLISKGERTSVATEIVEVRNCEAVERKATDCSAGTNNDLTVSIEGGIQFAGGIVSVNTSVANGLGIGHNSGESLTLDTPAEGSIYIYTIDKEYRLVTGEMLVRSSTGRETEANYIFHASCSIKVVNVETASCSTGNIPPSSPQDTTEASISAEQGWQNTKLHVEKGTKLTIEVTDGQWTYWKGNMPYNQGEGDEGYICSDIISYNECAEPLPDFPKGGLIGKVGNQVFGIGNSVTIIIQESGILYFRINDDDGGLFDNDGTLNVKILVSK